MTTTLPWYFLPFVWYGLTFAIRSATLLNRPRLWIASKSKFLTKLLSCPYCVGFHSGWLIYLLLYKPELTWTFVRQVTVHSFAAAAVSYLFDITAQLIEKHLESKT